ncbi:MAG: hypothetical protein ACKOZT_09600, partial [Cyanobium sp.]
PYAWRGLQGSHCCSADPPRVCAMGNQIRHRLPPHGDREPLGSFDRRSSRDNWALASKAPMLASMTFMTWFMT